MSTSGLEALLDGRVAAGVYRWDGEPDAVRRAVAPSRWSLARLDGPEVASRRAALVALGQALDLPPWYGANLDALWDCLRDLAAPTVVLWSGWAPLALDDPDGLTAVLDVVQERADLAADVAVLLRGAGPDLGLPQLDGGRGVPEGL